ncbi:MAG: transporter [Flavobacterium sp.]
MKKLIVFLIANLGFAQHTDIINSNRPGESQGAFAVGKTVLQVEAGLVGAMEEHKLLRYESVGGGMDLAVRYGAFKEQLELIGSMQYFIDQYDTSLGNYNRYGIRKMELGAKYLIYDPYKNFEEKKNIHSWAANQKFNWKKLIPAVSVYAGASFEFDPFNQFNEPIISPKATLITQNQLGRAVLVTNFYVDKIGTEFMNYGYIVTGTYALNRYWSAFLENRGYIGDYYSDGIIRGGLAKLLNDNLQIDASISHNIKNTPKIAYASIGLSWRYDGNYQNIIFTRGTKIQKEKKPRKKKKFLGIF